MAQRLLSGPHPLPDTDRSFDMFDDRVRRSADIGLPAVVVRRPRRWRLMGVSVGAGTTIAGAGVLVAGVAAATTLTTVFAPTTVAPVRINGGELRALAAMAGLDRSSVLGGFPRPSGSLHLRSGTIRWSSAGGSRRVASLAEAEATTGLDLTLPTSLPPGVATTPAIATRRSVTATITFDAAADPALAGSSLTVDLGPAVFVEYGSTTHDLGVPTVAIMTMRRPVATSRGATLSQLESYLLAQPGLPPDLAQQIRLFGAPGTRLPVPIPPGAVETSTVIGGSRAIILSDPSEAASGVIWEDGAGVIHTVAGLLDKQDVLSVAHQVG
jgi:hypothetical protein